MCNFENIVVKDDELTPRAEAYRKTFGVVPYSRAFAERHKLNKTALRLYCDFVSYVLFGEKHNWEVYCGREYFGISYYEIAMAYGYAISKSGVHKVFSSLVEKKLIFIRLTLAKDDNRVYFCLNMQECGKLFCGIKRMENVWKNSLQESQILLENFNKGVVEERDMSNDYIARKRTRERFCLVEKEKLMKDEEGEIYLKSNEKLSYCDILGNFITSKRKDVRYSDDAWKLAVKLLRVAQEKNVFEKNMQIPKDRKSATEKFNRLCKKIDDVRTLRFTETGMHRRSYLIDDTHIYNSNYEPHEWKELLENKIKENEGVENIFLEAFRNFKRMKSEKYEPEMWQKKYLAKDMESWVYNEQFGQACGTSQFVQCLYKPMRIEELRMGRTIERCEKERREFVEDLKKECGFCVSMRILYNVLRENFNTEEISWNAVWDFGIDLCDWLKMFCDTGWGGKNKFIDTFLRVDNARISKGQGEFYLGGRIEIIIAKFACWLLEENNEREIKLTTSLFDFNRGIENNGVVRWFLRDMLDCYCYPGQFSYCRTEEQFDAMKCYISNGSGWHSDTIANYFDEEHKQDAFLLFELLSNDNDYAESFDEYYEYRMLKRFA